MHIADRSLFHFYITHICKNIWNTIEMDLWFVKVVFRNRSYLFQRKVRRSVRKVWNSTSQHGWLSSSMKLAFAESTDCGVNDVGARNYWNSRKSRLEPIVMASETRESIATTCKLCQIVDGHSCNPSIVVIGSHELQIVDVRYRVSRTWI